MELTPLQTADGVRPAVATVDFEARLDAIVYFVPSQLQNTTCDELGGFNMFMRVLCSLSAGDASARMMCPLR